jgi:molybdate transport system substrate-binding protein
MYVRSYCRMKFIKKRCSLLWSCVLFISICQSSFAQERILIAAASDLQFAMDSIVALYEKSHEGKIDMTYGSSGKLTEQILNGAPFDIFFSADISYPLQLRNSKLTFSGIYAYAVGRIVLCSRQIDTQKGMDALLDPRVKKVAIANPSHAPYGKRAVEALKFCKLFETVKPKLVYGDNISQTAHAVATGAADLGIIALSLALSPSMKKANRDFFLIPEEMHQLLIQGAVITKHGAQNSLAESFFKFTKSEKASAVFKYFGFIKPQ